MKYNSKVIVSGQIIEVYRYEKHIECDVQRDARKLKADRFVRKVLNTGECPFGEYEIFEFQENESRKYRNRLDSVYRARREVRRLINANVSGREKFLTLTFRENVTNLREANYEFKKFRQRLEYRIGKKTKYLVVPEFQKRGAVHYHVVLFECDYIEAGLLASVWGQGFIKINVIDGCDNIGAYVCKYLTKDICDDRKKGKKSYFCSKGLRRPSVIIDEGVVNEIERMFAEKVVYQAEFENAYTGKVQYVQINLRRNAK